jgi:class 3 adenylate cyclase
VLALTSAVTIRDEITELNRGITVDRRIDFRFGLHSGDVVFEDQGIRGDAINTAAHLQTEAEPGQIVVSARIQQELAAHGRFRFEAFRPTHPKNTNEALAYRLVG